MSLKTIVARLGGDLYDGGLRASIPAPGHSPGDRSVSLLQDGSRVVIHSFGGADWREVRDHLRDLGLLDADGEPPPRGPQSAPQRAGDPTRRAAAERIWALGRPLGRSLSARHCRLRGIDGALPDATALRHGPQTPLSAYGPAGTVRPALLAGIRDPTGALAAVEITYLAPSGHRAERLKLSRKTIGTVPPGSAVRLAEPGHAMLVAEGVFTTLSAAAQLGLPGWALTSAGNLRAWRAPAGVEEVVIAADRGGVGERAAAGLRKGLSAAGLRTEIVLPPAPFGDWNEAAMAAGSGGKGRRKGGSGCV